MSHLGETTVMSFNEASNLKAVRAGTQIAWADGLEFAEANDMTHVLRGLTHMTEKAFKNNDKIHSTVYSLATIAALELQARKLERAAALNKRDSN